MELGSPRQRALLAVLLAHAGRVAALESLVDALWAADPPNHLVSVVHKHVGTPRRLVEPGLPRRGQGRWLLSTPGGYRIDPERVTIDVRVFRGLVTEAAGTDDPAARLGLLVRALELWRGPAGEGIDPDTRRDPVFARPDQEHAAAAVAAGELAVRIGRTDRALSVLGFAAPLHPTDEPLHARLVRSVAGAGRRASRPVAVDVTGVLPGLVERSC